MFPQTKVWGNFALEVLAFMQNLGFVLWYRFCVIVFKDEGKGPCLLFREYMDML
jgi:hypothetical protein